MPHLIFEHSSNITNTVMQQELLPKLHAALLNIGLFNPADVKSRAYEAGYFLVGQQGAQGSFAHIRVYILEGRSPEQKLSLSESLFDLLRAALPDDTSVTVDIRDLDKACYKKVVRTA